MCGRPGGAEHQREPERDRRDRIGHQIARRHDRESLRVNVDRCLEHRLRREAELHQHHQRHEARAAEQEAGLDDLHPGGRHHAAEGHVDDHQRADQDDRIEVRQTEQQLDQLAGADHLRDQVKRHHRERADRRQAADRRLLESKRRDVGERDTCRGCAAVRRSGTGRSASRPASQPNRSARRSRWQRPAPKCRGRMPRTCSRRRSRGHSGSR